MLSAGPDCGFLTARGDRAFKTAQAHFDYAHGRRQGGVGNRIEVWSEKSWEAYSSPENLSYDDLAEQLEDLGI